MDRIGKKLVLGRLVTVDLPSIGISSMPAKSDSGAYHSALHYDRTELVTDGDEKQLRVHFDSQNEIPIIFTEFKRVLVRNSSGKREKRYLVNLPIVIKGHTYITGFTLAKRKRMKYKLLLGRALLRNFIIDVEHDMLERGETV